MGHHIVAIVGAAEPVARIAEAAHCPAPTNLKFGFQIVPLGHDQIDALADDHLGSCFDGFIYLSPRVADGILRAIGGGTVAYLETNYFGGTGSQAAAVFQDGALIMQAALPVGRAPIIPTSPINTALRAIGVAAAVGQDEFETMGLSEFRNLEALGLVDEDDD